ncbi:CHIP6 protein [Drepanopeziza brunnea f. sp. 'multigermtubi' MB_m1]|uniref:CHIP6 protein n=2 Tax=Drepanopeziza brunnea f. sp. 'multigermtubi' TaxID=698441 RepID=K1WUC0_MARBU|nr:CHIP6 protein [Drepanopeziza brunnea f. sp. 'multigermtubi' MB_m1]EKD16047.1 CHIP6 protein [Drepanopeziza brunnea f. sp. 'multigermtubi' MB_m1]
MKATVQDADDASSSPDNSTGRNQSMTPQSSGQNTPATLAQDHRDVFSATELEEAFQEHQPGEDLLPMKGSGEGTCALLPERSAVWMETVTETKLSALAAATLVNAEVFSARRLVLYPGRDQYPESNPTDPISGVFAAAHSTIGGVVMGVADYPIEVTKMVKADRDVAKTMATDFALDSGKGLSRIVGTGLKAPMEFTYNISKGFGNVPKLYGDETVRKDAKVTGLASGLSAAGKGFGLGLFDGVTGLVTQPLTGAQKGGVGGFFAGLGKGIGGVVCKPVAGAVGLPANLFKGVYTEVQNQQAVHRKAAQLAQGQKEWEDANEDETSDIIEKWYRIYEVSAQPPKYEF